MFCGPADSMPSGTGQGHPLSDKPIGHARLFLFVNSPPYREKKLVVTTVSLPLIRAGRCRFVSLVLGIKGARVDFLTGFAHYANQPLPRKSYSPSCQ